MASLNTNSYQTEQIILMRNLNREIEGIKARSMKGLIMAAAYIRNDTEKTAPLTPVDLGNLRVSWFVVTATDIPVGKGSSQFKGAKAGILATEHAMTVTEGQSIMASQSSGKKKFLMMGYSANYALWVHENIGANFKRPNAGPKWLEASIKRNQVKIVQIIKDNAQIKK